MQKLSPDIEESVVRLWRDGEIRSTTEMARRLGIGSSTVRKFLERNGLGRVPRSGYASKTTAAQDAEIVARYKVLKSASLVGREYGLTSASILKRVHAAGIEVGVRGGGIKPLSDAQTSDVLRLRSEGVGVVRIGQQLGIGFPRVRRCLAENGYPTWNTTRRRSSYPHSQGYVWEAIEPDDLFASMATARGYVMQHRLVVARALGRPLTRSETVHHINGDRSDNRLANLQLRQGKHGKGAAFQCLDCGSRNVEAMPLN